jgi:hypothetical protein
VPAQGSMRMTIRWALCQGWAAQHEQGVAPGHVLGWLHMLLARPDLQEWSRSHQQQHMLCVSGSSGMCDKPVVCPERNMH